MLMIMIGTGLRCGELIGLTWKDVDTRARRLNVDHQLIYKKLGDGCRFHISTPKTDSGIRVISMTKEVQKAFEVQRAKKEHRKTELLPKVSAHVMRHTACTRMEECRMDIKILQYVMGHAHIDVTMDVYNHLEDRERIEQEIARLDSMAVNF